ncbi:hypothetical protein ACS0TY_018697 [Phlomoides rotata]
MDGKQTSLRVLMFPWLAHGHVIPYLELAKRLSCKNFHIYLCSTPIILDSISKILQKDSFDHKDDGFSIELVELHLPSLPELPPHYHTGKNLPPHLIPILIKAFHMSISNFSEIITNLKPDLLIYDIFQPWSTKIASSLGIPSVHFSTCGSTSISFFHHMFTHKTFNTFPSPAIRLTERGRRHAMGDGESIKIEDMDEGRRSFVAEFNTLSTNNAQQLNALLQNNAYLSFHRPRTGVVYDGSVPSNLAGIQVSAMRLRSGCLRKRGHSMFKEFEIPKGGHFSIVVESIAHPFPAINATKRGPIQIGKASDNSSVGVVIGSVVGGIAVLGVLGFVVVQMSRYNFHGSSSSFKPSDSRWRRFFFFFPAIPSSPMEVFFPQRLQMKIVKEWVN